MSTVIIGAIVFVGIGLAAYSTYRTKKKGGCAGCSGCNNAKNNKGCH